MAFNVLLTVFALLMPVIAVTDFEEICDGCIMFQGKGYKRYKEDCNKYVVCVFHSDGSINVAQSAIKDCGFDKFWEPIPHVCRQARLVDCPNDPCKTSSGSTWWPSIDSCRKYWVCTNGRTFGAQCCPPNQRVTKYTAIPGQQICEPDTECAERCGEKAIETFDCDNSPLLPDPDDPTMYLQTVAKHPTIKRHCPPSALFNPLSCRCDLQIPLQVDVPDICPVDVFIPLRDDVKDHSITPVSVTSRDIEFLNKAGHFTGHSRLTIHHYSNADFGNTFAIMMSVRLMSRHGQDLQTPMTLYSNGCDDQTAPIHVTINGHGVVKAKIMLMSNNLGRTRRKLKTLTLKTSGRHRGITLAYNNNKMLLQEDGTLNRKLVRASGNVPAHHCALVIGSSTSPYSIKERNFYGTIGEIMVYLCIPQEVKMS